MSSTDKPNAEEHGWHLLGTSYPFTSRWFNLRQDQVEVDGAGELRFTYVDSSDAVGIVPVTDRGEIALIRQYRYIVDEVCTEIPAGGMHDHGEGSIESLAEKELREETGGTARQIEYVGSFYTAVGQSSMEYHVFLALGVDLSGHQALEPTESIEVTPVPVAEAVRMARAGEIKDGTSALSILLCEPLLREHGYL